MSRPVITYTMVPVGEVLHFTDKAMKARVQGSEVWIPLSVIDGEPPEQGRGGVVLVADWYVKEADLPETDDPDEDAEEERVVRPARRGSTTATLRRVRHTTFGVGAVVAVEGEKTTVQFDAGPQRTILTRFLEDVLP